MEMERTNIGKMKVPKMKNKPIVVPDMATKGDEKEEEKVVKIENKQITNLKPILLASIVSENSPPLSPNKVQNGILSIKDKQLLLQSALTYDYSNPNFVKLCGL